MWKYLEISAMILMNTGYPLRVAIKCQENKACA